MTVQELAQRVGAEVVGNGSAAVTGVNTLEEAESGQVSFLANRKYAKQLETTKASAVIVAPGVHCEAVTLLKTIDPYYAFAQTVVIVQGYRKHPHSGVHPQAHVDATARVGEGSVLYPGVYVGPGAQIGRDCILYPNAVVYDQCVLGERVILHAGAVIGQDGYGYATHNGEHYKIPQIGNVVLENDVEVGANTCIARAAPGSTVVGQGTKIDAQVMIGHNTRLGPHGLLVAQVGIAGSVTIGHHATMGGQVGIAGHLKVGDNVTIGAQAGIMADVPDQSMLIGTPGMPAAHARRVYSIFTQLPELMDRLKRLESLVSELGSSSEEK